MAEGLGGPREAVEQLQMIWNYGNKASLCVQFQSDTLIECRINIILITKLEFAIS